MGMIPYLVVHTPDERVAITIWGMDTFVTEKWHIKWGILGRFDLISTAEDVSVFTQRLPLNQNENSRTVEVEWAIHFRVSEPMDYLYGGDDQEVNMTTECASIVRKHIETNGAVDVELFYSEDLEENIVDDLEEWCSTRGIEILSVVRISHYVTTALTLNML
jgi:regulator of protease activity HflC (stomatin/prohibitin superfamily)